MKPAPLNLKRLRGAIDRLDQRMVELLNDRAKISQSIGRLKDAAQAPVYAPDREREVLDNVRRLNAGPLPGTSLEAIYSEIMSGALNLERPLAIAYLGPEQTFTHQASVKKFGSSVRYIPCNAISDIFSEVESGRCDYGVAPVENSTEGAIHHTLDNFIDSDLKICSEVLLKINLNLLSRETGLTRIRRIYSKAEVFGQCRQWIEAHLAEAELIPASSTAHGAKIAASEKNSACIASILAAKPNRLKVIAPSIQDSRSNVTRFLVLSRQSARPTRSDKTSIMVSIQHRPGALLSILEPFHKNRINLTKIESRPSRLRQWDYFFFIDLEAHAEDASVREALKAVKKQSAFLKILGSYPRSAD
jgi:chorismate mutase/prephenate dehydratase